MTYTYATLEVSKPTYDEIKGKLEAAGYDHLFDRNAVSMQGIAIVPEPTPCTATPDMFNDGVIKQ